MFFEDFHPAVAAWFRRTFEAPTPAQIAAWPAIHAGRHTLVAAPTGSGKTLTAFLAALDALVREGLQPGGLADATSVVYVSPLKALSNDIRLNLEAPLAGIRAELAAAGLPDVEIRTAVRTGDTTPQERRQSLRRPPHILVTTPESLYVLLGSESGRRMLATTRSVIVDEIHALAAGKRGSHLALSLERLQALCARPLVRIGLSATQKPVDEVARFLAPVTVIGKGGVSVRDAWDDDDSRAYLGTVVPRFPNFFMLYGPNTALGHGGSFIFTVECQVDYLLDVLRKMGEYGLAEVECRQDVYDAYNVRIQQMHQNMIWSHPGMSTYFRNSRGRVVTNSPWRLIDFWKLTRQANMGDFDTVPALALVDGAPAELPTEFRYDGAAVSDFRFQPGSTSA